MQPNENDRALRDLIEQTQADLKRANERLAELEAQSTEALQAEVDSLRADLDLLKQRLEQADVMREQWDRIISQRETELAASRGEEKRLRAQVDEFTLQAARTPKHPVLSWLLLLLAPVTLGAFIALVALRACG